MICCHGRECRHSMLPYHRMSPWYVVILKCRHATVCRHGMLPYQNERMIHNHSPSLFSGASIDETICMWKLSYISRWLFLKSRFKSLFWSFLNLFEKIISVFERGCMIPRLWFLLISWFSGFDSELVTFTFLSTDISCGYQLILTTDPMLHLEFSAASLVKVANLFVRHHKLISKFFWIQNVMQFSSTLQLSGFKWVRLIGPSKPLWVIIND